MMRRFATLRSVRKPVLALVAAAGLVVWSGAGTAGALPAGGPLVPGQPSISTAEHGSGPALKTTAAVLHGSIFDAAERQTPRTSGGGVAPGAAARHAVLARAAAAAAIHAADPATSHALALARAGRDSDPATAPPSFPS